MDAICRHSNSVNALCCVFIMFKKIENPTASEMRSVIRFLNAKNMKPGEIHHQFCDMYAEHATSSSVVLRWVSCLMKDAKMCTMICVAADFLLWMQLKKRLERTDISPLRHFPCIFLKFYCHFSTKFCLIILSFGDCVHAGYQRCFWKNTKWQASIFDFLTQYSEEGKNFLSHVVTGNETWVSHEAPKLKQ